MASTGTPAERARDDGIDVITATTDMSELARTATDGTAGGLLILAADRSRHVLIGAAAVGPGLMSGSQRPALRFAPAFP
jgi:pyruvate/2-oxoglutarate dehydrogenase complex dihydrolipoamide dehydrogenase (E3) component